MKVSISVMIIFTTLLCVLPFVWFMLMGKNTTRKNGKLFKNVIKEENASFNVKEQWNNNFIGIDESKNVLMFIKLNNQETPFLRIDLNDIKSCQINKKTRDLKKDKKMESELQSVDLEFTYLTKKEMIVLNFYDINDEFSEDLEMKRAEKWQALIKETQQKKILNKSAA